MTSSKAKSQNAFFSNFYSQKGFAFVEYQMPEHAVAAVNALDGTVFMGRLLHILPGEEREKNQRAPRLESTANTSFKKEKLAKMRETATKDTHSWNSLFVGSNAVANEIAKRYRLFLSFFSSILNCLDMTSQKWT